MKTYKGKNSKTEYLNVIIRMNICHIVYLALLELIFLPIIYLLIRYGISSSYQLTLIVSYVLLFLILFTFVTLIVFIVSKVVLCVKNKRIIKYYLDMELVDVKTIMINYDYKLWLTAPKDSFHPMSFNINDGEEIKTYKTGIYFTNSEKYNKLPRFNMPKVLVARQYINNYAVVGYDLKNGEMIIIDYKKQ